VYNAHVANTAQVQTLDGGSTSYWPSGNADDVDSYALLDQVYQKEWDWIVRSSGSGIPYWLPLSAGWNKRPWQHYGDGLFHSHWNCTPTVAEFTAHLTAARTLIDSADAARTARTVVIYAWNEYGEGAYLAPSFGYGTALLDAIYTVFEK
jgi:hypothetical protein